MFGINITFIFAISGLQTQCHNFTDPRYIYLIIYHIYDFNFYI